MDENTKTQKVRGAILFKHDEGIVIGLEDGGILLVELMEKTIINTDCPIIRLIEKQPVTFRDDERCAKTYTVEMKPYGIKGKFGMAKFYIGFDPHQRLWFQREKIDIIEAE